MSRKRVMSRGSAGGETTGVRVADTVRRWSFLHQAGEGGVEDDQAMTQEVAVTSVVPPVEAVAVVFPMERVLFMVGVD